ncbi:Ms4527A family Cys-rich leader peptide [Mycobacterium parmense]|uniref:Ms4527A family Cys-rich leader peptide n=1 Tax=Mycobacterium parmense TaxID=185642 RepID=UPI003556C11C
MIARAATAPGRRSGPAAGLMICRFARRGTIGLVDVAPPSLRTALVARRHIDLKRVCSCICLP